MLEAKGLHLSIGAASILNGVDLTVKQGETVGLIGPNGSGKTTLFNCISGFLIPQQGTIHLAGRDVTAVPPFERAKCGLGRVFQNFGIFREMTIMENMLTALESKQSIWSTFFPAGSQTRKNQEQSLEFLNEVGLGARAQQKAGALSGGQMRLLEIARTLAFGADLFLLDEPTAGVSPKMKDDIAKIIERLKSMQKTIVLIEHDINFIQGFCNRIVVMDCGKVVLDDTPQKVRENSKLQEIYFGSGRAA